MNHFIVALLQLQPEKSMEKNMEKGLIACRQAKKMGADLAVFPEMWSIGYQPPFLPEKAITTDSDFVEHFRREAKDLSMAIAATFLEQYKPLPRNTVRVFDRYGRDILTYAKVHTCDFGDENILTPGDTFPVAALDTDKGTVNIGAMICYDREFPESARLLMLGGAEIVIVPNSCPMEINRLSQLRARAFENMIGIATVNYPYGQPDCNGHSSAFDGIAYRPGETGSRDTLIVEAGEREGIYLADFPLSQLRDYRNTEVHGNAYRHPKKYTALVEEKREAPFLRPDYRP